MRKPAILFLLMISIGLLFVGTASAALTVNVTVTDEDGVPVNVTQPGTDVTVDVVAATNNETLNSPRVLIKTNPDDGLTYHIADALMTTDGFTWLNNSDPLDGGFLYWSDQDGAWFWSIDRITDPMLFGNVFELLIPATVSGTGEITTDVIFEHGILEDEPAPAYGSYTFLSVVSPDPDNGKNASGNTVPMQDTGVPVVLTALALLGIVGGSLYDKFR